MTKTFREILAEKDDEYTYHVRSTADIHHSELFERIRLSFLPYEIKSFECDTYKPIGRVNKDFPDEPNSPTYSIKIVTGLPVPKKFIESLAMDARIHVAHLRIDGDDEEHELVNKPEEVSSSISQSMVGTKRLGAFIQDLQDERKKRMKATIEREVYESFCTTHRGLEDVVKKPLRKGYYYVEAYREDGKNYLTANGPYETRPNEEYRDRIHVDSVTFLGENTTGEKYGVRMLIEDIRTK